MENLSGEDWKNHLNELRLKNQEKIEYSTNIIEEIAKSVDAVKLFVTMVASLAIGPAEEVDEAEYGSVPAKIELLAYHLFPFFKLPADEELNPWHIIECKKAIENLFYSSTASSYFSNADSQDDPINNLANQIQSHTKIVRGSAFPEQTSNEIISIQGKFESWFRKNVGIGPIRAQNILWHISLTLENNANKLNSKTYSYAKDLRILAQKNKKESREETSNPSHESNTFSFLEFENKEAAKILSNLDGLSKLGLNILPVSKDDLSQLDPSLTKEEWNKIIDLIGLTVEVRHDMDDPLEVRQKPLFVLPDERVLLVDISNALDMLWIKFEQFAKKNQSFYQKRYQRTKADWLEEEVIEHLSKIFPPKNTYSGLTYPDPDKENEKGAIAEIDAVIEWGPFLILIEAKAKQFRLESHQGDVGRFRSDIKDNVEDAFEQAKRAVRYIDKNIEAEFIEPSNNNKLVFKRKNYKRIYLLTVSQHHLAGYATRLAALQDLGLFKDSEFPFSICIADLDLISKFCSGPDIFLHYIEKRLSIQESSENILADEIEFFGAYLDTRLQAERIWNRDLGGSESRAIWLNGWSDQFDAWYRFNRGEISTPPAISLKVPKKIQEILTELRSRDDDTSKWIAFALLDMSDSTLNAIAQSFEEIKSANPKPGMFRRYVYQEGEVVFSITGSLCSVS